MSGGVEAEQKGVARKFVLDVLGRAGFQMASLLKGLLLLPIVARAFGATGYDLGTDPSQSQSRLSRLL